jgi:hypothetical protein
MAFEAALCRRVGAEHGIGVSSGPLPGPGDRSREADRK